jgi:glyoxylase-like metal-dependent hydrolase (beta-lactamase superfamily II)
VADGGELAIVRAMSGSVGEIVAGLWRFEASHPEWTEAEGGEEGWEEIVAWWVVQTAQGLLLVDPLVDDWAQLDRLVDAHGGCAGIVRTLHWHQRSITEAAERYRAGVWARRPPSPTGKPAPDHEVGDGQEIVDGIQAFSAERADELALWLPEQAALIFGDAMLRRDGGELRVCPDSWTQPEGGPARLRAVLRGLAELPLEHVLVSHGPLVLGDGPQAMRTALAQ